MWVQRIMVGEGDWLVVVFYAPNAEELAWVSDALLSVGEGVYATAEAIRTLLKPNTGYTYTSYRSRSSVAVVSRATSLRQFLNTAVHELKHIVEHISTFYGVDPKSEEAGYLQGYVGGRMMEFTALGLACAGGCGRS